MPKRFSIKDCATKISAILAEKGSAIGVDSQMSLFELIAEEVGGITASGVKANVLGNRTGDNYGYLTRDQIAAVARISGVDPDSDALLSGSVEEFKLEMRRGRKSSNIFLVECQEIPQNIADHLVSVEISAAQLREPQIPVGGDAPILAEIRFNVSQYFNDVACDIALSSCEFRMDAAPARFEDRLDRLGEDDVGHARELYIKPPGGSSRLPFWAIHATDGVLEGVVKTIFARAVGIQVNNRIAATVSIWIKNVDACDPLDSLRCADGAPVNQDVRQLVRARLETMKLEALVERENDDGPLPLGRHEIFFRAAEIPPEKHVECE